MSNRLDDAEQIYIVLKRSLSALSVPAPMEGEDKTNYLSRIAKDEKLRPYIITRAELEGLIPRVHSKETWVGREIELAKLLQKMQSTSPKVIVVEGLDGNVHERLEFSELIDTAELIYSRFNDYSLALTLADIISSSMKELREKDISEKTQEAIIEAILRQIPLLNPDCTLFYEGLISEFSSKVFEGISRSSLELLARTIAIRYNSDGIREVLNTDRLLLGERPDSISGIRIQKTDKKSEEGKKTSVIITTSNGGGCHKNIAMSTMACLNQQGIDCAVINESELTQVDPLEKFIGISFASLYPVVFQQCGNGECRRLLGMISASLVKDYIPQMRFAQLRDAVNFCQETMGQISTIYSTQHYAEDLRVLPLGAKMVFQVCDYGPILQLNELVSLVGKIPYSDNIRFLIPSRSCLQSKTSQTKYDSRIFVESIYPTLILSQDEANDEYVAFIKQNELFAADREDVIRCSIVMGGMGCGDLISNDVDNILNEARQKPNVTVELIVACGNNKELKSELEYRYKDAVPGNVKLKFFGYVNNKQLIAYNKNAVLLTKPGGGTISECLQNDVQTLVHFDAKHYWEQGNVNEICQSGLGEQVVEGQPLLSQIEKRMAASKIRKREIQAYSNQFQSDIEKIISEIMPLMETSSKKITYAYPFKSEYQQKRFRVQTLLQELEGKNPKDKSTLNALHALEDYVSKNFKQKENKENYFQKLQELFEKYGKVQTVESVLINKSTPPSRQR